MEPESGDYNLPLTLRWTGPLDPAVLARALAEVVRRHEVLRTAFVARRGRPEPVVRRHAAPALPVVDLAALPAAAREAEARRLVAEDVRAPFDLARAPLLRAALLRLGAAAEGGAAEHLLRITVHHIVFDGWSLGILTRELAHLYRDLAAGRSPGLEPLPVQYGDYALWQHRWLGGALLDDQLAFWRSAPRGRAADARAAHRPAAPGGPELPGRLGDLHPAVVAGRPAPVARGARGGDPVHGRSSPPSTPCSSGSPARTTSASAPSWPIAGGGRSSR